MRSLERLLNPQLIEANTKSTESIAGASHVRLTSAGWYYLSYLVNSFAYLDLVLQDTPINDDSVAQGLTVLLRQVDNLSDGEGSKLERTQARFKRVREFMDYLESEESREIGAFELDKRGDVWQQPLVPEIRQQIEKEFAWIERRLRENREKFDDDPATVVQGQVDLIETEEESEDEGTDTLMPTPD